MQEGGLVRGVTGGEGGTQPGRLIVSFHCLGVTRPAYHPVEQQEQQEQQQGKNLQLGQQRPFPPPHSDLASLCKEELLTE